MGGYVALLFSMNRLPPDFVEKLYALNVGRIGRGSERHERPHKPLLLLCVLDLLDEGLALPDRIPWGLELRQRFKRKFEVVAHNNDRNSPELPFRHLSKDGFWEVYRVTASGRIPETGDVRVGDDGYVFATLTHGMDVLATQPTLRAEMRQVLVSRYFPHAHAALLLRRAPGCDEVMACVQEETAGDAGRSAGFRKAVLAAYDFQCAACGLRINISDIGVTIVDAAHLVPFAESLNDHPTNGISLCKNHHWAMDKHLIAPTREGVWRVSPKVMPKRSTGEKDLQALDGEPLLPPCDEAYMPDETGLRWREDRLIV